MTLGGIEQLKEARYLGKMRAPSTANGRLGVTPPSRSKCWAHGAYRVFPGRLLYFVVYHLLFSVYVMPPSRLCCLGEQGMANLKSHMLSHMGTANIEKNSESEGQVQPYHLTGAGSDDWEEPGKIS